MELPLTTDFEMKTRKRNGSLSPHSYCNYNYICNEKNKSLFFVVVVKNTLSCYLKKYSSCFVRNGTLELISPASFQGSILIEDEVRVLEIRNRIERVISRAISFGCLADFGKKPLSLQKDYLNRFRSTIARQSSLSFSIDSPCNLSLKVPPSSQ